MVRTLLLSSSLLAPRIMVDSRSWDSPSRYHFIWGGGEPPRLEQVRFSGFPAIIYSFSLLRPFCVKPSIATGATGKILGGDGFKRTVRPMLFVWRVFPVPASLTMQLKFPLSLLYVVFFIFRSYWPRDGKRSTLKVFFCIKLWCLEIWLDCV